ncbi:hypothetical protein [Bacillus alkalicellulosilyticus]|uniref:hypothetical protein n=1 Tax=Alkalihalobacterium alkalicellulosilyticum TaxID=1912214 RepID=UPI000998C611|nr:hypothetical protein [Bacillus alkalicellulosilyticus]
MKKVLLAIGSGDYSKILRRRFDMHLDSFEVSEQEVMHRRYLYEILDLEKPDILILHDYYLASDLSSKAEKEQEWISFIQTIREQYDDAVRVVFLCEREKGDPFLASLVHNHVLDIFYSNAIDMTQMIDQLKDKPRFSRVSKLTTTGNLSSVSSIERLEENEREIPQDTQEEKEVVSLEDAKQKAPKKESSTQTSEQTPPKEKKEKPEKKPRPIIKKVVEKKVNIVNKQVIKRDYHIEITNQVERVVGVPLEKKLVLVGSPFPRSGSTFVSHLLARELAKIGVTVTYIESPYSTAYSYDRFGGHNDIPNYRSKFYQFTKEIDPKLKSTFDWTYSDVNLIVKHPDNEPIYDLNEIPFDVYIKILLAQQSIVTIVDVGTDWHQEIYRDLYDIATHAYFIVEPDISNIQYLEDPDNIHTSFFREVLSHQKSSLIGNRFDNELLENELLADLYKETITTCIPHFSSVDVFTSHHSASFLNDLKKPNPMIYDSLLPIIKDLLPPEYLKKQKGGLFSGLFSKKVNIRKT